MALPPRVFAPRLVGPVMVALALGGCATLPASGPTVGQVHHGADASAVSYTVVPLDAAVVQRIGHDDQAGVAQFGVLAADPAPDRVDLIRRGDVLQIGLFEVGVSLFAPGGGTVPGAADASRAPTATQQGFSVQVREDGTIDLPYLGTVSAAGTYPEALAATLRERLRRYSEHPDVTLVIADSLRNTVTVGGSVSRPGRYRLTAGHERLLDAIVLAGGSPLDINETQVTLVRGERSAVAPLNQIGLADKANLRLLPGDRIALEKVRRSYTVFGASDRVSQVPFEARSISLAEAIARAGGPADYRANPRGVFLFRYDRDASGAPHAVVYQVNMLRPENYFLAQNVAMHDKDVLVFSTATSNAAQKLFGLLANLFNPFVAVRTAAQ